MRGPRDQPPQEAVACDRAGRPADVPWVWLSSQADQASRPKTESHASASPKGSGSTCLCVSPPPSLQACRPNRVSPTASGRRLRPTPHIVWSFGGWSPRSPHRKGGAALSLLLAQGFASTLKVPERKGGCNRTKHQQPDGLDPNYQEHQHFGGNPLKTDFGGNLLNKDTFKGKAKGEPKKDTPRSCATPGRWWPASMAPSWCQATTMSYAWPPPPSPMRCGVCSKASRHKAPLFWRVYLFWGGLKGKTLPPTH